MSYFCNICDITIKPQSENNHFESLRHREYEKCIQKNHNN